MTRQIIPTDFFDHRCFNKYIEERIHAFLNIALVLLLLSHEDRTVADLSKSVNTRPRQNKTVYDLYAVVERLERWGYIRKAKDFAKYGSKLDFCVLTEKGQDLLRQMPDYLGKAMNQYYQMYLEYKENGIPS